MILILNGAFGIGKTTVAQRVVRALPRAVLFNPEFIGIPLQRGARLLGREVADFQDLALWRRLTVLALRLVRAFSVNVVVPMAFSNTSYLAEIRSQLTRFDPVVLHICLTAPTDLVHERLRSRGADVARQSWEYTRATECCAVHPQPEFAEQIPASGSVDDVARAVLEAVQRSAAAGAA